MFAVFGFWGIVGISAAFLFITGASAGLAITSGMSLRGIVGGIALGMNISNGSVSDAYEKARDSVAYPLGDWLANRARGTRLGWMADTWADFTSLPVCSGNNRTGNNPENIMHIYDRSSGKTKGDVCDKTVVPPGGGAPANCGDYIISDT